MADYPKEQFEAIEELLRELESWDKDSYAFRYPVDKTGNRNLAGLDYINVRHLRDVIASVASLLDGSSYGMEDMLGWRNEMEAEMRSYYQADYY